MKNKLIYFAVILLGFLFFLAGCRTTKIPDPELIDMSYLAGMPCALPCWQNLWIGESTESDVLSILSDLSFINESTINEREISLPTLDLNGWAPGKIITANCIRPNKRCLTISISEGRLRDITYSLNYRITLGQVIESIGYPNYIGLKRLSTDRLVCRVEFIWVDYNLLLASAEFSGSSTDTCYTSRDTGSAQSNIQLTELSLLPPSDIEAKITNLEYFNSFQGVDISQ